MEFAVILESLSTRAWSMNDLKKATAIAIDSSPAAIVAYLKELWEELLRVPPVSPNEDFFSVGGDSALVIEMLVAISAHFDREFHYNKFFSKPTLATLSALIAEQLEAQNDGSCA
jgi:acyl carrier protein